MAHIAPAWPEPEPLDPLGAPVPQYGTGSLADLLPTIATGLGMTGLGTTMELAPADRACVFLTDGLGWELLRAHREVNAQGGRMVVAGAQPTVQRLLDLTGTVELFVLADSREQALGA